MVSTTKSRLFATCEVRSTEVSECPLTSQASAGTYESFTPKSHEPSATVLLSSNQKSQSYGVRNRT